MKYKTKLYLAFIGLAFCTTLLGLGLVYREARKLLFKELGSKVLTVAASAAKEIDGDDLSSIHTKNDASSPAFIKIAKQMRGIRDANRRNDIYVIYIYTIRPSAVNPSEIEVVVDSSENQEVFAPPGEVYTEGKEIGILNHLDAPWTPYKLIKDRWGTFLSGYAPIYDSKGRYAATLGVNLSAEYVYQSLRRLQTIALIILAFTLLAGFLVATFLSHFVTHSIDDLCRGVEKIGHGDLKTRIPTTTQDEFGHLAETINEMAKELEDHEKLKTNFVRYVSKHVLERILSSDLEQFLKGERKKITVLFSDIREFTRLAERLPPEEVVSILNEYLDKMLDVIFANNGTLDKFLGDGLMVEFGAPLDDPNQESNAVRTALEMQQALQLLNRKWKSQGKPVLEIGTGIHTGLAVVGNIGSEKRMEYTAIGDTVNVAARLEKETKNFKVPILVSETTMENLKGRYRSQNLGPLTLPGRKNSIVVYAIETGIIA